MFGFWRSVLLVFVAVLLFAVAPAAVWAADGLRIGDSATVVGTEGRGLRVRSGPGMSHRIVATVPEGTTVRILAGPVSDGDDDWYQVSVTGSSTGWGLGRYLAEQTSTTALPSDGNPRTFVAKMTAYANGVGGVAKNSKTATGTAPRYGVIAVDPKVISLGSMVTIEGYEGTFIAEDTGGKVKGAALDIWLPDAAEAKRYGTQYRRITVVREGR